MTFSVSCCWLMEIRYLYCGFDTCTFIYLLYSLIILIFVLIWPVAVVDFQCLSTITSSFNLFVV